MDIDITTQNSPLLRLLLFAPQLTLTFTTVGMILILLIIQPEKTLLLLPFVLALMVYWYIVFRGDINE